MLERARARADSPAPRSYDLDGNGSLAAEEVVQLVTRTMGGNARTVNSTLRAIGVLRDGQTSTLRRLEFVLMCEKAPNFMYPAFALQEALVRNGGGAGEALEALRAVLPVRRNSQVLANGAKLVRRLSNSMIQTVARRRSSVTFNFGEEASSPPAPAASPPARVGPARPARSAMRGAREASRSRSNSPRAGGGPATSPSPFTPGSAAGLGLGAGVASPASSSGEGLEARAFRAARLGRADEVEAAILRGGVSADVAFEPHRATLLHVAAAHGHRALCRRLLGLGAPPRARDALGRTAAEVALAYRHWATAEALQAAGVPVSPTAAAHATAEQQRWRQQQQQSDAAAYAQAAAAAHSPWPHQPPPPPGWGAAGMPQPAAMPLEPWQQPPRGRLDFGWGTGELDPGLPFGASPAAAAAPPWQQAQDAWGLEQQQPQEQQRDARSWDAAPASQVDDGFTEWAAQPGGAQARGRAEVRTQGQLSEQDEMAGETGGPADHAYRRRRNRA